MYLNFSYGQKSRSQIHSKTVMWSWMPAWFHLNSPKKSTGHTYEDFSIMLFEVRRLIWTMGGTFCNSWIKRGLRVIDWCLAGESIYPAAATHSCWYHNPDSLGFKHGLMTGDSPGMSRPSKSSWDCWGIQSWSKWLPGSLWGVVFTGLSRPYHKG